MFRDKNKRVNLAEEQALSMGSLMTKLISLATKQIKSTGVESIEIKANDDLSFVVTTKETHDMLIRSWRKDSNPE